VLGEEKNLRMTVDDMDQGIKEIITFFCLIGKLLRLN